MDNNYRDGKRVKEPVVSNAQAKEKSIFDDIKEFFGIRECRTFRDYVGTLSDLTNRVYGAIDLLTGGRGAPSGGGGVTAQRPAYAAMSIGQQPQKPADDGPRRTAASYSYTDVEFENRADAEAVLFAMMDLMNTYTSVSVADFFDLCGITSPNGYTDNKYGWKNLDTARVMPVGRKYRITGLPTPVKI